MEPNQQTAQHPHTRLFEGGQAVRLFPEADDIYTQMKTSFLFELLSLTMRQGLDNELEATFVERDPTIWVPLLATELMRAELSQNPDALKLLDKPTRSGQGDSGAITFLPLKMSEFAQVFRHFVSSGHLDQLLELLRPNDPPVWVAAEHANTFKRFVLDHGLHQVDRRFRMLLQSQTCQCRGKSG